MNMEILLLALMAVETGDRPAPPSNWQVGPLQVTQQAVDDVNKRFGTEFKLQQCEDLEVSKNVARLYFSIWGTRARLCRKMTYEDGAAIWRGGPTGPGKLHRQKRVHVHGKLRDYCERVVNLCAAMEGQRR